jgi:ribosomal protein S17E/molybdopterin converting factor small subunit
MDRIKRISNELLEKYPDRFSTDFDENKEAIKQIAVVRSKLLRNKIAGYITSYLHRQALEKEMAVPSEGEDITESELVEEGWKYKLINIKLLGGIKKTAGRSSLILDKHIASISEVLTFLKDNVHDPRILDSDNILVTINGADSSMLSKDDNILKTGDSVTIVTIVHGGWYRKII